MATNFRKHFWYYITTIVIFSLGLALVALNAHDTKLQALFIVMTATCYFVWSLLHHYVHHELHVRVVIEYILIALLGVILSMYLFSI